MVKDLVQKLFPDAVNIEEIVTVLEKYRNMFALDTDLRLKHFLAQVREEVGPRFEVRRENLNYAREVLPKLFRNFTQELADKYGRSASTKANQEMIGNIAYANKLGNGNVDSGDGYKYRGAGCLQITGKDNFKEVQSRCIKYAGKEMDPNTLEGFIVFGMAFWLWKDIYKIADKGSSDEIVNSVTATINKYTDSYGNRLKHFNSIKTLLS